ncbi:MAG: VanZ family protein [Gallionellaceae bacterium]
MQNNCKNQDTTRTHLRNYLSAGYVLFIVYVSLTPFKGWQQQGLSFVDVLLSPVGQTFTGFDFTLNLISYFPLGFLLFALLHGRWSATRVLFASTLCGLLLSTGMEYAQMFLPSRVSSNTDMLSNTAGTLFGAAFAMAIAGRLWFSHLSDLQQKWFKHGRINDFGLALIALWVFAQTNPSLPMLGSVFVREVARWPFDIVPETPFNWLECAEVTLNLILLGILLSNLLRERRHAISALLLLLLAVTLIKFFAAALLLKSWALLLWMDSEAMLGMLAGLLLLLAALRLPHRKLLATGALSAVLYLVLLQDLLLDSKPYAAMRMYHWHYIHMLNYNGLSQLVILLFPVLLIAYLWRTGLRRK